MRTLLLSLALLCLATGLFAQSSQTNPSITELREVKAVPGTSTCVFAMVNGTWGCAALGTGISITGTAPNFTLAFTGSGASLPAPVPFAITTPTQTFTMNRGPANGSTLGFLVWRNGLLMNFGSDYTVTQGSGTWTITFTSPGQTILANDIVQVW